LTEVKRYRTAAGELSVGRSGTRIASKRALCFFLSGTGGKAAEAQVQHPFAALRADKQLLWKPAIVKDLRQDFRSHIGVKTETGQILEPKIPIGINLSILRPGF
jgi:hypothetical protein